MSRVRLLVRDHRATQAYRRPLMSLLSKPSVTALTTLIITAPTGDSRGLYGLVSMQKD
jgi:hypothetical protein